MANYTDLKAAIQQVIRENGNEEITGTLLQQSLLAMVNSLGAGYLYMGIATPEVNPGTPDQNVFYFALTAGTYTDFGGIVIAEGETSILRWNSTWHKDTIEVDAQADWDQNDPAANDYIKHRTHYVEPLMFENVSFKLRVRSVWLLEPNIYECSGTLDGNSIRIFSWRPISDYYYNTAPEEFEYPIIVKKSGTSMIVNGVEVPDVFDSQNTVIKSFVNVGDIPVEETVHKLDQKFLDLDGIIPGHGTFAERPAANKIYIGYTYFRTDGAGGTKYPIFYGGDNKWYKADGTEVTS